MHTAPVFGDHAGVQHMRSLRQRLSQEWPPWLVRLCATASMALVVLGIWSSNRQSTDPGDDVLITAIVLGLSSLCVVATSSAVCWRWPRNRLASLFSLWAAALGAGLLQGDPSFPTWLSGSEGELALTVIREVLIYWIVLAWPTGHLGPRNRRWLAWIVGLAAAFWLVAGPAHSSADHHLSVGARQLFSTFEQLSVWTFALAQIIVSVALSARAVIQYRSLPRSSRRADFLGLLARLQMMTFASLILPISELWTFWLFDAVGGNTEFHDALLVVSYSGSFTASLALIRHVVRRRRHDENVVIDLDSASVKPAIDDLLAGALGDSSLRVESVGHDQPESTATPIMLDGRVVAQLHTGDDTVPARWMETAVVAAAADLRHRHLREQAAAQAAELSSIRELVIESSDGARRRLERDLHDGAQQQLLGLQLSAQIRGASSPNVVDELRRLQVELRHLTSGLGSAIVGQRGLVEALRVITATAPMSVDVRGDGLDVLSPEQGDAVWYFVNEALANAARHGHASSASISVARHDDSVTIAVADDGRGGARWTTGGGLSGLLSRLEDLGGQLSIDPPGRMGSRVVAVLPCSP